MRKVSCRTALYCVASIAFASKGVQQDQNKFRFVATIWDNASILSTSIGFLMKHFYFDKLLTLLFLLFSTAPQQRFLSTIASPNYNFLFYFGIKKKRRNSSICLQSKAADRKRVWAVWFQEQRIYQRQNQVKREEWIQWQDHTLSYTYLLLPSNSKRVTCRLPKTAYEHWCATSVHRRMPGRAVFPPLEQSVPDVHLPQRSQAGTISCGIVLGCLWLQFVLKF